MRLSARGYHRVLRVARTIADLAGAPTGARGRISPRRCPIGDCRCRAESGRTRRDEPKKLSRALCRADRGIVSYCRVLPRGGSGQVSHASLSHLPAFPAPELTLEGLSPDVARNVKTALADAAEGMKRMPLAEARFGSAAEAAREAREAEKKAGREVAVTLNGISCRYGGETKDSKPEGLGG